ncbi:hypothetical protein [Aquibacillus rhizosphaerae]|uniref:Spore coat protein n=1 Tax=Aquibacillus rhizosphaerae TaxID=3051431 RepID=A0ABT7LEI5_9BACI|nr:hypothetical protein [Aquibacillus sp. LR5S19]MDL4842946.1 hypothetical protein [Aquibacillus sp. LR5S19]
MSEKKKVIYVKDLVIKADNVTIEPPKHQPRPRPIDPFFGPRREEFLAEEVVEDKHEKKEEVEADEEVETVEDDYKKEDDQRDDDHRRPFSWI